LSSQSIITCAEQARWQPPADGVAYCIQHSERLARHAAQHCACVCVQAAVYPISGQPELRQRAALQRARNIAKMTLHWPTALLEMNSRTVMLSRNMAAEPGGHLDDKYCAVAIGTYREHVATKVQLPQLPQICQRQTRECACQPVPGHVKPHKLTCNCSTCSMLQRVVYLHHTP
jgi:hypothetical protein